MLAHRQKQYPSSHSANPLAPVLVISPCAPPLPHQRLSTGHGRAYTHRGERCWPYGGQARLLISKGFFLLARCSCFCAYSINSHVTGSKLTTTNQHRRGCANLVSSTALSCSTTVLSQAVVSPPSHTLVNYREPHQILSIWRYSRCRLIKWSPVHPLPLAHLLCTQTDVVIRSCSRLW